MKMEFTVQERVILNNITPKVKGQLELVKNVAWFRKDIDFSQQERDEINLRVENDCLIWDKELIKEIEVVDEIIPIIAEVLKMLDTKKMLTEDFLSLCEKFIPETEKMES